MKNQDKNTKTDKESNLCLITYTKLTLEKINKRLLRVKDVWVYRLFILSGSFILKQQHSANCLWVKHRCF